MSKIARGALAIAAGADPRFTAIKRDIPRRDCRRLGVELPALDLQRGGVVGATNIVDCVSSHTSPWYEGKFGFILDGSRSMPFFPWKGALGLRDVPAGLLVEIVSSAATLLSFRGHLAPIESIMNRASSPSI